MGQKYRVGDRIICIKDYGIGATRGDLGTVIKLFDNLLPPYLSVLLKN